VFDPVRLRVFVSTLGPPDRVEIVDGPRDVGDALAAARSDAAPGATLADRPADPPTAAHSDAFADAAHYVAARELESKPVTATEPDFGTALTRYPVFDPVRLRVFVSTLGPPDRVEIVDGPRDVGDALAAALMRTTFVPGRRGGSDAAAYIDYEFSAQATVARLGQTTNAGGDVTGYTLVAMPTANGGMAGDQDGLGLAIDNQGTQGARAAVAGRGAATALVAGTLDTSAATVAKCWGR